MAPVSVSGLYIFRGRERDGKFGGNRAGRFSSGGTDGLRAALCSFPLEVEEQGRARRRGRRGRRGLLGAEIARNVELPRNFGFRTER